jgi:hypothetical protein
MGIFGNLFGGNDEDDDDDRPVAPWQNVSQEAEPVDLLAYDDDSAVYVKDDGTYLVGEKVYDNEGDA